MDTDHDYRGWAAATRVIGRPIRLLPLETVQSVKIEDGSVVLTINAVRIKETSKRWHVTATGIRMIRYLKVDDSWRRDQDLAFWDDTPNLYDVQLWGRKPLSRQELYDQAMYEQDCYRPGTNQQPRDSFERESQGYAEGGVTAWRNA